MNEKDLEALHLALKPFLETAQAIPDHWNGAHQLRQQIGLKRQLPTVGQYRDLLAVAQEVFP